MPAVTVSPKFQVVIPKEVRERLGIHPGQKLLLWDDGTRIQMAPAEGPAFLRGVFRDRPLPPLERAPDRDF
ncbi:MAG: AbrB/MazE/SpoVT family DNA-binding domain-containing protein [Gemmatimonadetes bacterium]|nr:AbrB/MazE/SpoVT family DNA-binding domain-containing protein [Gemmatimonadota bacterium]